MQPRTLRRTTGEARQRRGGVLRQISLAPLSFDVRQQRRKQPDRRQERAQLIHELDARAIGETAEHRRPESGDAERETKEHARDEAHLDSDVDVFVDPVSETSFDFLKYMDAYETIRKSLGENVPVGYSTREGLSPYVRTDVEHEAIQVF